MAQTIIAHHHYPDGFVVFLDTMFATSDDRDEPGRGFTLKTGDIVTIATAELGALTNRVIPKDKAEGCTIAHHSPTVATSLPPGPLQD